MHLNFNMMKNVFFSRYTCLLHFSPVAANLQRFALNICHFNGFGHCNEIVRCAFFKKQNSGGKIASQRVIISNLFPNEFDY